MACVYSTNFYVLINGSPTDFFKATRGVRQGYPLPPYLFLLIIEGFSRFVSRDKSLGLIQGVRVTPKTHMTHLLFVDDVMCFVPYLYYQQQNQCCNLWDYMGYQ